MTVAVNGKKYEVEYSKTETMYEIRVPDPAWIAPLPNPFHVIDAIGKRLQEGDSIPVETTALAMEIFRQIKEFDAQRGQA